MISVYTTRLEQEPSSWTETNTPIQCPPSYAGLYSIKLRQLADELNDAVQNLLTEEVIDISSSFMELVDHLQNYLSLDHLGRLVRASEFRKEMQRAWDIFPVEAQAISYDFTGMLPSIRAAVKAKSSVGQKAMQLDVENAREVMNVLFAFIKERPLDELRDDAIKLLRNISDATETLPSNLVLKGIIYPNTPTHTTGGYGDVSKGMYKGQCVAIKVLKKAGTGTFRQVYRREVLVWALLDHQNISRLLGVSEDLELSMVSPYLPGNLGDLIASARKQDASLDNKTLIEGICSGVEYLHTLQPCIIHADLCPNNILIDEHGQPQINDYGLSRIKHNLTRTNTVNLNSGSVRYLAPELLEPDPASQGVMRPTRESDIWALGLVIWQIITLLLPFEHCVTDVAIMRAITSFVEPLQPGKPTATLALTEHLPIVNSCWWIDPSKRATIQTIVSQLRGTSEEGDDPQSTRFLKLVQKVDRSLVGSILGTGKARQARLEQRYDVRIRIAKFQSNPKLYSQIIITGEHRNVMLTWNDIQSHVVKYAPPHEEEIVIPHRFNLDDALDDAPASPSREYFEQLHRVSVTTSEGYMRLRGPKAFVDEALIALEPIIRGYEDTHESTRLFITRRAAARLLMQDPVQAKVLKRFRLPYLREMLAVDIELVPNGTVLVFGPKDRLPHAVTTIRDVAARLDREIQRSFTHPESFVTALHRVLPEIIDACDGPSDPDDQAILVEEVSYGAFVVSGDPGLVIRLCDYITSNIWYDEMHIVDDPLIVEDWMWVPLVDPIPLGLMPLREFGFQAGKVDIRFVRGRQKHILLSGPRQSCASVRAEIHRRQDILQTAQHTKAVPTWATNAKLDLKKDLRRMGVVVDDESFPLAPGASIAHWTLTAKDENLLKRATEYIDDIITQDRVVPIRFRNQTM